MNTPTNNLLTRNKDASRTRERGWIVGLFVLFVFGVLAYALIYKTPTIHLPDVAGWVHDRNISEVTPGFYKVEEVSDGDTIVVDMDGTKERVRLIGIDTPETHKPNTPVQCFGPEASNYLKQLLDGRAVRLEADPTNTNRDRYNRLLRYVYLEDSSLVNQQIVREGYGFAYTRFPFTKVDEFLEAEKQASNEKKGLWSTCKPVVKAGQMRSDPAE